MYRAIDRTTNMPVAVKRMLVSARPDTADAGALYHAQRFEEECKLLKNLIFPGIPRFVDSFADGDRSVIVMEFIEGVDLEKQVNDQLGLAGEDFSVLTAVEFTIQVARILEYMHAHRPRPIVHRDVKPANIIVRHSDNRLYLVDFGLAREVGGERSTKTAVGTVGYAPMEQYRGRTTTRTDQYSLGVTLHFMLSGQHPLPLQVEPLDKIKPDLPHELCWVVRKATMHEQEHRFESMYEFRQELEKLLPVVRDYQRRLQQRGDVQNRLDLLGPTQELAAQIEAEPPAQRLKIEGVHPDSDEPMKDFGLHHPLADGVEAQMEFQRQAIPAERRQNLRGIEIDGEVKRRSWWSVLAFLFLVAGIASLYVLNGRQQRRLSESILGAGFQTLGSSGFFEESGRVGLGRQGMDWPEYLLSMPLTRNDGFRAVLPGSSKSGLALVLDAPSAKPVPLFLAFVDSQRKVVRSYWCWARQSRWASPQPGSTGQKLDLNTDLKVPKPASSSQRNQWDLDVPDSARELVVLLPQPAANPLYFRVVTRQL